VGASFVSKIDLSYNELTSQLISLVKREKGLSKYLKTIAVKGIKLDHRALKKEGFSAESLQEGRISLGDLVIEF
jgi:hypothetical protein